MTDDPFVRHRGLLFTVAYEMLGSAADAEDVVQETWLRWDGLGEAARGEVREPRTAAILDGEEQPGADDLDPGHVGTNRTRSPGASSAGGSPAGSNITVAVEPRSRQPPGESRG